MCGGRASETDLDLRNSRFRSAVADLAAPMHGVAKDELEGEDIRRHRRARRLVRAATGVLVVLLVVAVTSAIVAFVQRSRANDEATRADRQAAVADARRLAAQAVNGLHDDLARSVLLAIEGQRLHDDRDTRGSLVTLLQEAAPVRTIIHGSWDVAALTPDGAFVAVAGPNGVFRIDLSTGRFTRIGHATYRDLKSAALSPDGKFLALGGRDVHVLEASTGAQIGPALAIPSGRATSLRFSPDSRELATLTDNGDGRLWSTRGPRSERQFGTNTYTTSGIDFSPDGKDLAGTGYPGFDLDTRSMGLHSANDDLGAKDEFSVAYSPDGRVVAVGQTGRIVFRDPRTGLLRATQIDTGKAAAVLLSYGDGGRVIAAALTDGTVSLWDAASGSSLRPPLVGATRGPLALRYRRDGTLVLATSAEIIVYDSRASFGVLLKSRVPTSPIFGRESISFSTDGLVAVSDTVGGVEIWNAATRHELRRITVTNPFGFGATAVSFQPKTHIFAVAAGDGTVARWDATTGRRVGPPIRLTDANPGLGVLLGRGVFGAAFNPSGQTLAALAGDGRVAIIDATRWRIRRRVKMQAPLAFGALAFSPDGHTVAAGGPSSLTLADITGGTPRRVDLGGVDVRSVTFTADGRTVAAGLADGRIAFVDPTNARVAGTPLFSGHGSVDALSIDSSAQYLVAGNDDATVRLWDLASRDVLGPPLVLQSKRVDSIAVSPDNSSVISGGADGSVAFYDLTLSHWIASLCRIAGRNLRQTEWQRFMTGRAYHPTCPQWPAGP